MEKIIETKFYYLCCLTGIAGLIKPSHANRKKKKRFRRIFIGKIKKGTS
jgi:hypothetical protein